MTVNSTVAIGAGAGAAVIGLVPGTGGGQAVADPFLYVDPSWEFARYIVVEMESLETPGAWVKVTRDWQNPPTADTIPPVLTLPANITADATSPAGATVNYTVTATDNSGLTPTVSCIPLSGVTFAVGATTVSCTAPDGSGNSSTGSFTVTVNGAVAQLEKLIASLGIYMNPWTTSLDAKLQNAMDALTAMKEGNT